MSSSELRGIPRQVQIVADSNDENEKMEFIKGTYEDKASGKIYDLSFLRSKTMRDAAWLISRIYVDGDEIWSFKDSGLSGRAQLFYVNKELVIATVNRYEMIKDLIPVAEIGLTSVVTDGEREVVLGGRSLKQKIRAKQDICRQHPEYQVGFSEEEKALLDKERELREKATAEMKARQAEERREQKKIILARPKLQVYSEKGESFFGQPVTEAEWRVLEVGTYGILVESYDEEAQEAGQLLEAFCVVRVKGGRKDRKVRSSQLSLEKIVSPEEAPVEASKFLDFFLEGEIVDNVPVITREDLPIYAKRFNSGTKVALPLSEGKFQIHTLEHGKARALCEAEPV